MPTHMRLCVGDLAPVVELRTLHGELLNASSSGEGVVLHLQFRRFAGCPICNLHVHSIIERLAELRLARVREIIVFHSGAASLRPFESLPIDFVADPQRTLYDAFGVGASIRSIVHPRALMAAIRGMAHTGLRRALDPSESHIDLPAEFLIGAGGRIRALKYGAHADDQWRVDEILDLVRSTAT